MGWYNLRLLAWTWGRPVAFFKKLDAVTGYGNTSLKIHKTGTRESMQKKARLSVLTLTIALSNKRRIVKIGFGLWCDITNDRCCRFNAFYTSFSTNTRRSRSQKNKSIPNLLQFKSDQETCQLIFEINIIKKIWIWSFYRCVPAVSTWLISCTFQFSYRSVVFLNLFKHGNKDETVFLQGNFEFS